MSHNTLQNYYKTIFNMSKYHSFSIDDIESMFPFERDLYQDLILADMETEKNASQKQQGVVQAFTPEGDRLKL